LIVNQTIIQKKMSMVAGLHGRDCVLKENDLKSTSIVVSHPKLALVEFPHLYFWLQKRKQAPGSWARLGHGLQLAGAALNVAYSVIVFHEVSLISNKEERRIYVYVTL
jgi:hypothetical protein